MSSKLLSILLLLFVPFPMHGIVQYDYKAFFLPYNFGHLYTWTFTISKIVTQASLVEISDKTFAVQSTEKKTETKGASSLFRVAGAAGGLLENSRFLLLPTF